MILEWHSRTTTKLSLFIPSGHLHLQSSCTGFPAPKLLSVVVFCLASSVFFMLIALWSTSIERVVNLAIDIFEFQSARYVDGSLTCKV
ncbi:hypothetical protein BO94DRAFT_274949 [Aspergillus sclerotioniger CBS 115572]|uniref:Uncharacterized protein n=1 Tax=Aspergillus sclerotioniger CBS 115572 TaxID=1450535 RepID=A0A317X7C2_9EURO|nr:hypothetical protein BO94DRAFT_274949 [Aspergillus sclerotioniger CBS 115572]PWY94439.1 hypothetical protein BO94DRAFT_274949 [Aspergillus sclerotioniger CBS 115572]